VVPESQDGVALFSERASPLSIDFMTVQVLSPIEFHDETSIRAAEICDVRSKGMLPPEFQSMKPSSSKVKPQLPLRVGLIATQATSKSA
jgi:hypothetical protein